MSDTRTNFQDDNTLFKLFGFEIKRSRRQKQQVSANQSIVPPQDDDGSSYVQSVSGTHIGQYVDFDNNDSKDNAQLIQKYRAVAFHPEVDLAIDEIVNESIVSSEDESIVDLNMDNLEVNDSVKTKVLEEFEHIVSLLNFNDNGYDMFKRWYIDGRLVHHIIVDENNMKAGIKEIRHIDAAKVRKVKQIKYKLDPATGAKIVDQVDEFFIFEEKPGHSNTAVRLSLDSVSYVTSGLLDERRKKVVSYLHKALKPINQLRMMEDALVIYRLARAPERRVFYIDVGNLPRNKAEEYMAKIMTKYRNKLVYDASTGELRDDRKHMSMLEDFWLPRKEGGRGTEITTLPGGENLGQIDDIIYFQKRMYRALNVPINRIEQEAQFSLGRSTEISRDEVKFQKFVDRLRKRFDNLFLGLLQKQLVLKGIITEEDWDVWKEKIIVTYQRDNQFSELRDAEMLRERLQTMDLAQNYIGTYMSRQWAQKNILRMDEEEIKQMKKEIDEEGSSPEDQATTMAVAQNPMDFAHTEPDPDMTALEENLDKALLKLINDDNR